MMSRLFRLFLCTALLFTTKQAFATDGQTISGFVRDESNGETLIAVGVSLKDTYIGATTNKSGYYIISNVPVGKFTVVFSYIGYKQQEVEVNVSKNQAVILNVTLTPQAVELEEVVISAEREKEEEIKTGTIRMNTRMLQRAPQMAEADLMRILQMLPGVLTLSEFSSGLYIRGGTPDQNLILLDNTEIYNANHLFGVFSTFDIDAIKEVELLKGGFPAQYGGRLSSVLDITNMDGNQKNFEGKTAIGLVSAKTSLQGPIGKGSWFFSGRRTYIDYIINSAEKRAKGEAKEQLETIPDYYFYDVHAKVYQDLSHNDKITITYYGGRDQLDFDVDPFEFNFGWGNSTFTGKWTHIFSEKLFANFYITESNYNVLVDRDDAFFEGRVENNVDDFTLKTNLEYFPSNTHVLKLGLDYKKLDSKFFQRFNNIELLSTSGGSKYSLYLQDNWELSPLFQIQSGIRLNYYRPDVFVNTYDNARSQKDNRFDIEPRLAMQYRLTENTLIKSSWGHYRQYINIVPFGNADFSFLDVWFSNDNSYEPGEAYHYITGIETKLPYDIRFDWEIYYKDMNHLYEFDPTTNEVLEGKDLFYAGEGYAYGLDFYFEKNVGKFAGWLGYSLGWTKRDFPEINAGKEYFPKYDRRNNFNIVGTYQLTSRWSTNFAWSYGTGQAYTQPVSYYRTGFPDGELAFVIGEEKNISRLPPYHRLDSGIRYERKVKKWSLTQWTFYIQIFNLYNRRNIWFRNIDFHYDDNTVEELEVRMLPIVPTLGLEFYF